MKKLTTIIHFIWAISAVTLGTTIGALYGWEHHGWIGAIALGFVGFCFGALAAASPQMVMQILR
jgi:uncharacterized membrane protein HdeD (DUF308 family)